MWPQHEMAQFWSPWLLSYSIATSLLPGSLKPQFCSRSQKPCASGKGEVLSSSLGGGEP